MIPAHAFVPPQDVIAVFEELCDELPANSVEGWHRSFQSNVGSNDPNFWNTRKFESHITFSTLVH